MPVTLSCNELSSPEGGETRKQGLERTAQAVMRMRSQISHAQQADITDTPHTRKNS
ncbi:hypothetical protein J6590_015092 [Homalodisca vitripennis]|nr:hypothetical protein J6590_015092 [Homalodisca vitripennis]